MTAQVGGRASWLFEKFASVAIRLDEDFCREVASYYECAPALDWRYETHAAYDALKRQTLLHYKAIINAGIEIKPWRGSEQPYRNSRHLRRNVRQTRQLYVYLTSSGHGPAEPGFHPLRAPSGIRVDGVEFCYNDLFRAAHDVFGHIMFGNGFGLKGEFLAVFYQMHLYSQEAHPSLFTEQIGQICWFHYGPHLLASTSVAPSQRPYAEQKVFLFPQRFLDRFRDMFELAEST